MTKIRGQEQKVPKPKNLAKNRPDRQTGPTPFDKTRDRRPKEPEKCKPRWGRGASYWKPSHQGLHFEGLEICRMRILPRRNGVPQMEGTFRFDETRHSMKCVGCLIACAFGLGEMHENMSASNKQAMIEINSRIFLNECSNF